MFSAHPMLAVRDGRLLLTAQASDAMAIGVAAVALPWLVLKAGGSHGQAGLVYALTVVPYVVFGLLAGALSDRHAPRVVMLSAHAFQTLCALVIPLWTIAGTPPLGVIFLLAFVIGGGRVFADAGSFGAVSSIVGPERFGDGQATLSAAWGVGLFAGPALGGALVAAVGPGFALWAEAGACALATVLVAAIRTRLQHPAGEPERSSPGAIVAGVRYMADSPGIAIYTIVLVCTNLACAGAYALMVPLLRDHAGLPAGRVGAILAAGELSALAAAAVAGPLSRRFGPGKVFAAGLIAGPLGIAVLGVATSFGTAVAAAVPFLLVQSLLTIVAIGERQRRVPARLQGRVGIAGRMAGLGSVAAGSAIASALSGPLGLSRLYLAMAVAALAVALVSTPFLLRLRD